MQYLDKHFGPPVCRSLLFLKAIFSLFEKRTMPDLDKQCRNIVVIKFFGMGSILLVSPVLGELKARYKKSKITMVTLSSNRKLCEILPSIDEVVVLDISGPLKFTASFFKMLLEINKRKAEVIIDLEFLTNFSAMVTLLADFFNRHKVIVGFNSPLRWRNRVHNLNVSFGHSSHISKVFIKVARSLKADVKNFNFKSEQQALVEVKDLSVFEDPQFKDNRFKSCKKLICVNVNSGELCLHRRWPANYFVRLIESLAGIEDFAVVLIGGKSDLRYVSEIEKKLSPEIKVVNLAGKTSLPQLIALFVKANLLISNDSGPLHLAEVIGLATVSFFGPETPALYGPLGDNHYVFYSDLYCSPCINIYNSKMSACANNLCLQTISVDKVLTVIKDKFLL